MQYRFDGQDERRINRVINRINEQPFDITGDRGHKRSLAQDPDVQIIHVTGSISNGWYPGVVTHLTQALGWQDDSVTVQIQSCNGTPLVNGNRYRARLVKAGYYVVNDGGGSGNIPNTNFYGCVTGPTTAIWASGGADVQVSFGPTITQGQQNYLGGGGFTIPNNNPTLGVYALIAKWYQSTAIASPNMAGGGWKIGGANVDSYGPKRVLQSQYLNPDRIVPDGIITKIAPGGVAKYYLTGVGMGTFTAQFIEISIQFLGTSSV